jgi:hypothetical protein
MARLILNPLPADPNLCEVALHPEWIAIGDSRRCPLHQFILFSDELPRRLGYWMVYRPIVSIRLLSLVINISPANVRTPLLVHHAIVYPWDK